MKRLPLQPTPRRRHDLYPDSYVPYAIAFVLEPIFKQLEFRARGRTHLRIQHFFAKNFLLGLALKTSNR